MYLVVDVQSLQAPGSRHRGIGRYGRHLLQALAAVRPQWRIEAIVNSALPEPDLLDCGAALTVRTFDPLLTLAEGTREANERYFGDWLAALGPDAVLELSFFEEMGFVPRFSDPRPLLAGIAYDLIPLIFHEHYLTDAIARAHYGGRLRQFAQADLLLAISEATRDDVRRLLRWPDAHVVSILGAADVAPLSVSPERIAEAQARFGIDRPFMLYVGGTDHRKNLRGTLAAFAALPPAIRQAHLLVIVCALTREEEAGLRREAARLGVDGELRLTNYVDDPALQTLYHACRLSIFPSFYEGLGLPVLEALLCGAPVVASNCAAIPEFAGPLSRLADPASPRDIAAAIEETLTEPRDANLEARRRFAAGFRWTDAAGRAAAAIEAAVPRRHSRGRRARVAWVSPLPPTESSVARQSAELLPYVAADFDIEVVVSAESTVAFDIARRFDVVRSDEVLVRHEAAPYDLFVYHVGNGERHLFMLDLLRRRRGLTVLHDLRLGELAVRAAAVGAWPDLAADIEAEGLAALAGDVRRGAADPRRIAAEAALIRPLIASSEAVAVRSPAGWGPAAAGVPVFSVDAQDVQSAARQYGAAILLTIARRARTDAGWRDAASAALHEAARHVTVDDAVFERWAAVRASARAVGVGERKTMTPARLPELRQ